MVALAATLACGEKSDPAAPTAAGVASKPPGDVAKALAGGSAGASVEPSRPAPRKIDHRVEHSRQRPSKKQCEAVCAHALTLTLETLPADAADATKNAIRTAMKDSCVPSCQNKGNTASVACMLAATSAPELAGCDVEPVSK